MTRPSKSRKEQADTPTLFLSVPMVPPSVNRYVRHTLTGRHYVGKEAKEFKRAVRLLAGGRTVRAERYELTATVYLGHNQRGDGDNFWKVIADSLVEAGVIHSDAAVDNWLLFKSRDRANPRTEIAVRGIA